MQGHFQPDFWTGMKQAYVTNINQDAAVHSCAGRVYIEQAQPLPIRLYAGFFLDPRVFDSPFKVCFECLRFAFAKLVVPVHPNFAAESGRSMHVSHGTFKDPANGENSLSPMFRFPMDQELRAIAMVGLCWSLKLMFSDSTPKILAFRQVICARACIFVFLLTRV